MPRQLDMSGAYQIPTCLLWLLMGDQLADQTTKYHWFFWEFNLFFLRNNCIQLLLIFMFSRFSGLLVDPLWVTVGGMWEVGMLQTCPTASVFLDSVSTQLNRNWKKSSQNLGPWKKYKLFLTERWVHKIIYCSIPMTVYAKQLGLKS